MLLKYRHTKFKSSVISGNSLFTAVPFVESRRNLSDWSAVFGRNAWIGSPLEVVQVAASDQSLADVSHPVDGYTAVQVNAVGRKSLASCHC